jgi:tripartite-type tricarboxylate transporter receptor subunit TctC
MQRGPAYKRNVLDPRGFAMHRRDVLTLLASVPAAALGSRAASAQAKFPERPIRVVVPFSAGGVVDAVARQWVERVQPLLGTMVIENQGGAGGTIGAGQVARAQPDGHTMLLANTSVMVLNPAIMTRPPYDPVKDFAPIAIIAISASGIMVHPSVPATNLTEFIAYVKANAGKLSYGSAGSGTMTHLAGELFKQLTGSPEIVHVPYKGAGPSVADLVSGHIPMATINVTGQLLQLHRTGKIRILAVTSPQRLKGAPEIPTAIAAGLPNMVAQLFTGLFVPAGTPQGIVEQVHQASHKAMGDQGLLKALTDSGLEPIPDSGPDQTRRFIQEEVARWTPIVKAAGLKLE